MGFISGFDAGGCFQPGRKRAVITQAVSYITVLMKRSPLSLILFAFLLQVASCDAAADEYVDLGGFTESRLSKMIKQSFKYETSGEKIDFISGHFIGVPYLPLTLIGSYKSRETLTINLAGLDCFTYLDYVDALRLSSDYGEFRDNLIRVRYKGGRVSYAARKHFFSDWPSSDADRIRDVTRAVGGRSAVSVTKLLNAKKDGTNYLNGIPVFIREVTYIPSARLSRSVTDKLKTGDYVGIYSDEDGLDVSHTGILIRKGGKVYLRNASSRKDTRRVLDEELLVYLKDKPGIVVYRPL